jgi:hypothetical protein
MFQRARRARFFIKRPPAFFRQAPAGAFFHYSRQGVFRDAPAGAAHGLQPPGAPSLRIAFPTLHWREEWTFGSCGKITTHLICRKVIVR